MNGAKKLVCVRNLHTLDGRGTGIVAEKAEGEWVIRRIESLSGETFGKDAAVYDGEGGILIPALTDLCGYPDRHRSAASLREETTLAARCGYGTVAELDPPVDEVGRQGFAKRLPGAQCRLLPIHPLPADPGEIAACAMRGAVALSDGGRPVGDHGALLSLMEAAAGHDLPLILSPVCPDWSGMLRAGKAAQYYRVPGIPDAAEELAVSRILILARESGCRVHLSCVSTAGALRQIKRAKEDGVRVSCGVTPFHFALSAADVFLSGTAAKIQPPLRDSAAQRAILAGIADGTVDCIASGHVPCRKWEKQRPMEDAIFGSPAYATALGVGIRCLVQTGVIDLSRLISLMSEAPAAILGQKRALVPGARAEFAVLSPGVEWVVGEGAREDEMVTPFAGQTLRGRVIHSFIKGEWR